MSQPSPSIQPLRWPTNLILAGSKRVAKNFSPRATSMLSLPYLFNWHVCSKRPFGGLPAPTGVVRFRCPFTKLLASSLRSQTTIGPSPTTLRLAASPIARAFFITATPLNLHKCSSSAASFKQLYRTRPARLQKIYLPLHMGRVRSALAFMDLVKICFRLHNHSKARCSSLTDTSTTAVLENLRRAIGQRYLLLA